MVYISSILRYKRREDLEDQRLETIWIELDLRLFNVLICCFFRSDFNASQSFLSQNCNHLLKQHLITVRTVPCW